MITKEQIFNDKFLPNSFSPEDEESILQCMEEHAKNTQEENNILKIQLSTYEYQMDLAKKERDISDRENRELRISFKELVEQHVAIMDGLIKLKSKIR
jgi:hypothetical protein